MKKYIALIVIVCIGIFLRFYKLTTIPPSLSHDETAIAYSAYSVLKTGKDEYGKPFPILFRSFDDYKLPGMVYSTIPFVALFGKNELAARLPSALFGTLAIIVMYFIALELTGSPVIGLLSALTLALQPWHINFSRQLFESNGAVFWFMIGAFFLLRSRKNYNAILWAGLCFVLALYFYYSVRLVIPFVALFYLLSQWKRVIKMWKTTALTIGICFLAFLPLGREMVSPGGWERINMVSVVHDPNFISKKETYTNIMASKPTVINKIIYNRRVALMETIIENYWKNISPHNLFVTGTGTYGALYPFDAILIPLGLIVLFTLSPFAIYFVLLWLFTAFLPGAFSINQPNTLRTLIAAPVLALLSGFGLKNKYVAIAVCIIFLFVFPKFYTAYFINNPTNNAVSFADGTKQMVEYVKANENKYDRIYISGYYWRPYIFMLYWGGANPADYQQNGTREHIGKYYFSSASWDTNGLKFMDPKFDFQALPHDGKTLFILANPEYQLHQKEFQKITGIHGRIAKNVFIAAILQIPAD